MSDPTPKVLALLVLILLMGCEKNHIKLPLQPDLSNQESEPKPTPTPTAPPVVNIRKIIILYGQSNMLGIGQDDPFTLNQHVTFDGQQRGPGVWASSLLADSHPDWEVVPVQCSVGGKPIAEFMPGTPIYLDMQTKIRAELAKGGTLIGMFYYQGESDARDYLNLNWGNQFNAMVSQIRADFNAPTLPVVWAQLGTMDYTFQYLIDNWKAFQDMQATTTVPNSAMVKTNDLPNVGHVHHDKETNRTIGQRFYTEFRNLGGNQ